MSSLTVSEQDVTPQTGKVIQPGWVRVTHWINAFAMALMIMSGWQIYNASPLFDFRFPSSITLGGWLAGALLWPSAGTRLLVAMGLVVLTLVFATAGCRRKFLPFTRWERMRQ